MEKFLKNIVSQMITKPDELVLNVEETQSTVSVYIKVNDEDCGTIVGKSGATIKSIRDLLNVYLRKHFPESPRRIFIYVNEETRKL